MKIKTITSRFDSAENFDAMVNEALENGWTLTRREVLQPLAQSERCTTYIMLYAELVKVDEPAAPMIWQEAVRALKETCIKTDRCDTCEMQEWCDEYLSESPEPQEWEVPVE